MAPLAAVMIVVDNSESSRNGDYTPTRFEAQADAVNIIFQTVVQGNPESSVGLMSMGGKGPEVLVTLTTDQGKILDGLHRTKKKIRGLAHLATGIQVAGLALKHRQNKSQKARIIVFVCSPIEEVESDLVKLAKKMKKNNTAVDFILFGDTDEENHKKLETFNREVKGSGDGSHLVVIHPSGKLLSDQLLSTPILLGEGAGPSGGSGAGAEAGGASNEDFPFGIDPSVDPELALALRMSMEEEKARQEKKAREEAEAAKKTSLESVEEADESKPLLDKDGQPGGSGSKKDDDKMDTS
jgi:26S proteasome regulatory subunit N10